MSLRAGSVPTPALVMAGMPSTQWLRDMRLARMALPPCIGARRIRLSTLFLASHGHDGAVRPLRHDRRADRVKHQRRGLPTAFAA